VIAGVVVYLAWSCCVPRVYLARTAATYTGRSPGASAPPSAQAVELILAGGTKHNLSVDTDCNDLAVGAYRLRSPALPGAGAEPETQWPAHPRGEVPVFMRAVKTWTTGFRLLLAGQVISLLGDGIANIALIYAVLDVTSSATDLGIVFAAQWLPLVVFSLLGGVLADRFQRLRAMIGADLARTVSQGLTAALVITGHADLAWFIGLQALHGAASAVFNPAIVGVMPELAAGDALQQGNAVRGVGEAVGNLAGPAVAGLLVVLAGPGWALAADGATFAVSAACLLSIRTSGGTAPHTAPARTAGPAVGESLWRDLREGWSQFRSRTWVWSIVCSAAVQNLLYSAFFVLGPIQAGRHYDGVKGWALVLTCAGIGSVAGGALTLRIRPARPLAAGCLLVTAFGLPALTLGLGLPLAAVAATAAAGGMGLTAFNSLWQTALQQHIPLNVLSRVSAYDSTASFASIPLGLAIAGPLAALVGASNLLIAAGLIQLLAGLAPLAVADVRHLARPGGQDPTSEGKPSGEQIGDTRP
jgi:MFS family permease